MPLTMKEHTQLKTLLSKAGFRLSVPKPKRVQISRKDATRIAEALQYDTRAVVVRKNKGLRIFAYEAYQKMQAHGKKLGSRNATGKGN